MWKRTTIGTAPHQHDLGQEGVRGAEFGGDAFRRRDVNPSTLSTPSRDTSTLFTPIGSCRLQGIDPHAYLVDVLGRVQDHPSTRVQELTPKAWQLARSHPG